MVVKPAKQGSALGLTRVDDASALPDALLTALSYGDAALAEKWIDGSELAVSVLDDGAGGDLARPARDRDLNPGVHPGKARRPLIHVSLFAFVFLCVSASLR